MRACDDDWWTEELWAHASYFVPDLQVDVRDPDDEPRILGPDGEPAARWHHRFGFQPRPYFE